MPFELDLQIALMKNFGYKQKKHIRKCNSCNNFTGECKKDYLSLSEKDVRILGEAVATLCRCYRRKK